MTHDEDEAYGIPPARPRAFRLVGPGAAAAAGRLPSPLGAPFTDDGDAVAVILDEAHATDLATVARALPAPSDLDPGMLVVVLPHASAPASKSWLLASRFFAALGRGKTVPRVLRSSALLARGYVELGACVDDASRLDLAWGRVPPRA